MEYKDIYLSINKMFMFLCLNEQLYFSSWFVFYVKQKLLLGSLPFASGYHKKFMYIPLFVGHPDAKVETTTKLILMCEH